MQNIKTAQTAQNTQTVQFIAHIAIPVARYQELDTIGCKWVSLGTFADKQTAEQAVKDYPKPYDAFLIQQE